MVSYNNERQTLKVGFEICISGKFVFYQINVCIILFAFIDIYITKKISIKTTYTFSKKKLRL